VPLPGTGMMLVLGCLIGMEYWRYGSCAGDLDLGFGFLPVLSEMGEIREFRYFSVKFSNKI
jgi:hypothetical protein